MVSRTGWKYKKGNAGKSQKNQKSKKGKKGLKGYQRLKKLQRLGYILQMIERSMKDDSKFSIWRKGKNVAN